MKELDIELTDIESKVLSRLQKCTKGRPLTRERLRSVTGMKDAHAREIIGALRDKGFPIINSYKGGYYLASDEEFREWIPKYKSYINTMLKRAKAMERRALKGQVTINEL